MDQKQREFNQALQALLQEHELKISHLEDISASQVKMNMALQEKIFELTKYVAGLSNRISAVESYAQRLDNRTVDSIRFGMRV